MKQYSFLILLFTIIIFFTACEGNKVKDRKAKLRTINVSHNTGNVNLYVDYEKVYETDIQYTNYTFFREFIEGPHVIEIKNASGNTLLDTSILMTENRHYSIFVYDSMNNVRLKIVDENFVTAIGSFCKVRFLHLSNSAPNVDVVRDTTGNIYFQNYNNGLNSEYVQMNDGHHQFIALNAGTQNILTTQNQTYYKAGAFYTLLLKGNVGATGVDSLCFFAIESTIDY